MALTKTDKKEIKEIFNEGLTEVVIPVLDKIINKLDEHTAILEQHSKDISILKGDVTDVQLTVNRIETWQKTEVERVDDHEVRIEKLEKVTVL